MPDRYDYVWLRTAISGVLSGEQKIVMLSQWCPSSNCRVREKQKVFEAGQCLPGIWRILSLNLFHLPLGSVHFCGAAFNWDCHEVEPLPDSGEQMKLSQKYAHPSHFFFFPLLFPLLKEGFIKMWTPKQLLGAEWCSSCPSELFFLTSLCHLCLD